MIYSILTYSNAELKRGDSGAWVVNAELGIVYGHVLSIAGRTVYILPLEDLLQDISNEGSRDQIVLFQPFTSLTQLAKLHWSKKDHPLAREYAAQALKSHIIGPFQRQSPRDAQTASQFIQWARLTYGLETVDIVYPDLQQQSDTPQGLWLWRESESTVLSSNPHNPDISTTEQSRTPRRNTSAPDREKRRHGSYNEFEMLKRKSSQAINTTADAHLDNFFFTELLKTLRCIPEPINYLEIMNYLVRQRDLALHIIFASKIWTLA
jgi:hypothetical protein